MKKRLIDLSLKEMEELQDECIVRKYGGNTKETRKYVIPDKLWDDVYRLISIDFSGEIEINDSFVDDLNLEENLEIDEITDEEFVELINEEFKFKLGTKVRVIESKMCGVVVNYNVSNAYGTVYTVYLPSLNSIAWIKEEGLELEEGVK